MESDILIFMEGLSSELVVLILVLRYVVYIIFAW